MPHPSGLLAVHMKIACENVYFTTNCSLNLCVWDIEMCMYASVVGRGRGDIEVVSCTITLHIPIFFIPLGEKNTYFKNSILYDIDKI